MNILFSLTYFSPYISGLTLYAKRLADGLTKKGHTLTVVTMLHDSTLDPVEMTDTIKVIRAKPIMRLSKGFLSFDWIVKTFQEVRTCDCVFVILPQFEGCVTSLWAKVFGKKLVSIYLSEVVLSPIGINRMIQFILNWANRMSLSLSDVVVTYGSDFSSHSRLLPAFRKKIKYIYPPIDYPKVDNREKKLLMKKLGNQERKFIGFVGRLAAEKGIEYLLETIPYLRGAFGKNGFCILIVGPEKTVGEDEYRKKIETLLALHKDNISLIGQLQSRQMGAFYSLLDVLVLPSVNSTEGFGMVQVEAMIHGVPAVVSDLPGVREPIRKTGMGIIVPPRNSSLLADAIVEISGNKSRYMKKKEFIRNTFSLQKTLDTFETIIEHL